MGADSLGYLSLDGLHHVAASNMKRGICDACFSRNYPVSIEPSDQVPQLSLFSGVEEE
jgi:glutamine phosphoribosylpyrophosphate amidotransferase